MLASSRSLGSRFYKMRCNWQRWLWGLIPLMMVSWVAVQVERGRIEEDLSERAKRALAESGLPWANVELKGRDVMLTGRAVQDSEPPRAEETLRKVWGVRDVENRAILPPKVEPFVWAARRRGNRIRLMGYVPDRSTRQTVIGLTKAAMPGLEVVDRMNTARGVPSPDTWLAGLSFALKQLSSLKQGEARFEDLALVISGEADDAAAFKNVNAALKSGLPKGIKLTNAQITAPTVSPFTWSAEFVGGQLVLAGHVAGGESARAELLAAAKAALPGANPADRMEPAEGAPPGWTSAAAAVMKELVRLKNGTAEMKDAALSVTGVASDETQAQAIRAALRTSLPPAFKLTEQIRVLEVTKAPAPDAPAPQPLPKQTEQAPPVPAEPPPKKADVPAPQPPPEIAPKQVAPAPQAPAAPPKHVESQPKAPVETVPKVTAPAQQPAPSEPVPKAAAAPPMVAAAPAPQAAANACQDNLSKIADAGHVLFATDSATLDSASFLTLDRLAVAARSCPGMRIAIEGHTDAEGSPEYNQRLSVRRARAVVAYLVKAGADRAQFEAVGYGFSRPVMPNDTAENMAKNRRIEFSVRQQ